MNHNLLCSVQHTGLCELNETCPILSLSNDGFSLFLQIGGNNEYSNGFLNLHELRNADQRAVITTVSFSHDVPITYQLQFSP